MVVDSNTTVMKDGMVSLRCEVYGYISDIVWLKNGTPVVDGNRHSVVVSAGSNSAQIGGKSPTLSMVSTVNISQVMEEDAGSYTCLMNGTAMQETVLLTGKLAGVQ